LHYVHLIFDLSILAHLHVLLRYYIQVIRQLGECESQLGTTHRWTF